MNQAMEEVVGGRTQSGADRGMWRASQPPVMATGREVKAVPSR